jgi:hypothetical protein
MLALLNDSTYQPAWTALAAIGQALGVVVATIALLFAWRAYRTSKEALTNAVKALSASHYTELDSMYLELLNAALPKPHLVEPARCKTDAQKFEYDVYALMVWNFIEAACDRCHEGAVGGSADLWATWECVIKYEAGKHKKWFDAHAETGPFKKSFVVLAQRGFVHS